MSHSLPGYMPSPNIQDAPETYEIENLAADPDGRLEQRMSAIAGLADWNGKTVLDIGAGTGFHIPRFHATAQHVIAVEPHAPSRLRAMARVAQGGLERASVMMGTAEALPIASASVDVAHARFAYFFGPGSEPGIAELERVMRRGGVSFIIDNDLRSGEFAEWVRIGYGDRLGEPDEIEQFWADQGFTIDRVRSEWRFERREDLEAVVRIEFPAESVDTILAGNTGTRVSYDHLLIHRTW